MEFMKKLLIILCLVFSFAQSANKLTDQKAKVEVWVIDHERSLKLKECQNNQIKEIIDDVFNKEVLKAFPDYSEVDIKYEVRKRIEDELWYLLLDGNEKKELDFILQELIQDWYKEHQVVVDEKSKIWFFINGLLHKRFDFTVSFACNNCYKIAEEVFSEIYQEIRIYPEFRKFNLDSKEQVIDCTKEKISSLAFKFRRN